MFNIGDVVYQARTGQEQTWIQCPECLGTCRLRVILGDNSEVSIPCNCCEYGYEGSKGMLSTYTFVAQADLHHITGVESEQRDGVLHVRYRFGCYSSEAENVFATPLEAVTRALELKAEHEAEEKKRLGYKEKQNKKWSWNVRYWRSEIRRAKETIAHCEAKLSMAPKNIKEADEK